MSLYSKLEKKRAQLHSYQEAVSHLTQMMIKKNPELPAVFSPEDLSDAKPLIILCSSSKGLCGGLNSSIMKFFNASFFLEAQQKGSFIAIGRRSVALLREKNFNVIYENEENTVPSIPTLAQDIVKLITEAETVYTSVHVYYMHLKSFFAQVPTKKKLIPFDAPDDVEQSEKEKSEDKHTPDALYTYEQEPAVITHRLAAHYLYTNIVHALFHTLISENAARFIAMDQSTNNADTYLETLALSYNKSRQSSITQEIAELAANMD